ncbi:MAG: methyl-accepting chemotaxis protein [Nitrospiria bacterium]
MFLTIKSRLIGLSLCCLFLSLCVGISGYWGLSHVDQKMDHMVLYKQIMRSQLEADMMHDAVWGSVLATIVETENGGGADQEALMGALKDNVSTFRERLGEIEEKADRSELVNALEETLPVLNKYISNSERIGALSFVDRSEAIAALPSFNASYEKLAGEMEQLSDLVSKIVLESQSQGAEAVVFSKQLILGFIMFMSLMLALVSSSIVGSIRRGFSALTDSIKRVSDGNLTVECPAERMDELGVIAVHFNKMTTSLANLVRHITDDTLVLSSSSEKLSTTSEKMQANAEDTEQQANTVEKASQDTDEGVRSVLVATEEMSTTIREISKNIQESATVVKGAVDTVRSANESIRVLGQSSTEVGGVIKVITDIAEQTNLLALNATIEAARAGEAGKGFSVVANEVKELSKATAKATAEITQRIVTIQSKTSDAVEMVNEISNVITKIDAYSTNISGAVEEQSVTIEEITRSLSLAATGMSKVSDSISTVSMATKDTSEGAVSVMSSSQDILKLGRGLKSQVEKFQVDSKGFGRSDSALEQEMEPAKCPF